MLLRNICTSLQGVTSQNTGDLPNFIYYHLIQDAIGATVQICVTF